MIPLSGRVSIMDNDETLAVRREGIAVPGNVAYPGGKPAKLAPVYFYIACNVQPLTGAQLRMVPEGDRYLEQYNLWVPSQALFAIGSVPPAAVTPWVATSDLVLRLGAVYQVAEAMPWGSYIQARMVRVDVGPDVSGAFPPPPGM